MNFPRFKKSYLVYLLVAVVAVVFFLFYRANKYSFIRDKLTDAVASKTDSLYHITYDSIAVDEAAGDLSIYNVHLQGDTLLQSKYIAAGDTNATAALLDVVVPVIKVRGFKTVKALLSKELVCAGIHIVDPRVTVYVYPSVTMKNDVKQQGQELYKKILGNFQLIKADSISVTNAEVVAIQQPSKRIQFHTFNTGLVLKDVLIDSAHYNDTTRTLFSRQLAVHTDRLMVGSGDGGLKVTNLTFNTNDKLLSISAVENNGGQSGTSIKSEGIVISGLTATGPLQAMDIVAGDVRLVKSSLNFGEKQKEKQSGKNKSAVVGGIVRSFELRKLVAETVSVKMPGANTKDGLALLARQLQVSNLVLDSSTVLDASFFKRPGSTVVTNQSLSFRSKDDMYDFVVSGLQITPSKNLLAIQQFAVKPRLGEKAFAKKARVQRDRYDVSLRNIKAIDINFEKLANGEIDMAALSANNNSIKIYRDISNPLDSIRKVGGYPHQLLYKMKMPVRINKVTFSDSYISYKERNGLSDSSGNLFFDHSTISLTNVTNHPTGANKIMNMDVDLNLLGRVPLAVNIKFYLDKVKEGHYHVNAVANKSFNGVLLNQITMPMGLMKIEKGTVNGLSFQFMADNINAQGELTVKYEGLKISLMKRDKKGGAFDKKGIISLLANLVVKNNNPANGKLRTAEVVYKRDEYKSFFNMIWKFAFNGLKDVMGAKL